jgi:peptidoglycan/xylan/chitin deacetylase (PgdA/CDA1 family)
VHCAVDIDSSADNSMSSIESGLDRARDTGDVLEIYAHDPSGTLSWSTIESVLAGARSRGLAFVTFADIVAGARPPSGGLALSFDDAHIDDWFAGRAMFQQYDARLTFWIAYYDTFDDDQKAELQQLAADGHAIEAHTVRHQRAPEYVEQYGVDGWMSDEVDPSIDRLRDDGYTVDAFAYPYGSRTDETDAAVLRRVPVVRSVAYAWDSPAMDPCPY